MAVCQCGANVGNLTVRLPTPDGQSTTHFATPTVLYLQPSLAKAYVGLSICVTCVPVDVGGSMEEENLNDRRGDDDLLLPRLHTDTDSSVCARGAI